MRNLSMSILKSYSAAYDYNLNREQLRKAYDELTFDESIVSENDIFDEFEYILENQ